MTMVNSGLKGLRVKYASLTGKELILLFAMSYVFEMFITNNPSSFEIFNLIFKYSTSNCITGINAS